MRSELVFVVVPGALVVLAVIALVVRRTGLLYHSPRYLAWRRAKSRRDRGRVRAEAPSTDGGSDPTSGW